MNLWPPHECKMKVNTTNESQHHSTITLSTSPGAVRTRHFQNHWKFSEKLFSFTSHSAVNVEFKLASGMQVVHNLSPFWRNLLHVSSKLQLTFYLFIYLWEMSMQSCPNDYSFLIKMGYQDGDITLWNPNQADPGYFPIFPKHKRKVVFFHLFLGKFFLARFSTIFLS